MSTKVSYTVGAELPDVAFAWRDSDGDLIDFASGHTFTLKVAFPTTFTQASGITGAATDPNVTVAFAAAALDGQTPGVYAAQLWARRTSDGKDRVLPFTFEILAAI
jgi:hypothetical protein